MKYLSSDAHTLGKSLNLGIGAKNHQPDLFSGIIFTSRWIDGIKSRQNNKDTTTKKNENVKKGIVEYKCRKHLINTQRKKPESFLILLMTVINLIFGELSKLRVHIQRSYDALDEIMCALDYTLHRIHVMAKCFKPLTQFLSSRQMIHLSCLVDFSAFLWNSFTIILNYVT